MNAAKFAVRAIKEWNPFGPEAYARRDRNKAYRKARKKKKRGEALTETEAQILDTTQEVGMLQGKKTYIGIAVAALGMVLGWLGIGECAPDAVDCVSSEALSAQIMAAVDQVLTIGGLLLAAYGRAKAKPAA